MCQGLWYFLPTLPSNVQVSIHTTWHTTATQIFKSQLHFLWGVCVYHSHMATTRGHLMIQGMREGRPSPELTSVRPAFSCWGVSLDYRKALWGVCRHRWICGNNASALRLPCGFLPDTTAFPLPSSHLPSPPGSKREMLLTLWDSALGTWPSLWYIKTTVPQKRPIQNQSSQKTIFP